MAHRGAQGLCETACSLFGAGAAVISLHRASTTTAQILHEYEEHDGAGAAAVEAIASLRFDRRKPRDGAVERMTTQVGAFDVRTLVFRADNLTALAISLVDESYSPATSSADNAVVRMLEMWWQLQRSEGEGRALRCAIDMSEVGVLILDARMQIAFANTCARALLADGDGLLAQGEGVTAYHLDDAIRLQVVLQHVIDRSESMDADIPLLAIRRADRRALVATVISASRHGHLPADPAVILFVLDPEQDVLRMLGASCSLHGLTETESRLTRHLVSGLTVTEAAAAMRIQCATARAYLKQIFVKTGTHRQTDLVRLMLLSIVRTPRAAKFHAVG